MREQSLLGYLRTLRESDIEALLRSRPETLSPPCPATLAELATRLLDADSLILTYTSLPTPHVELLGALSLIETLGQVAGLEIVARRLGTTIETLTPLLDALAVAALAWSGDGGVVQLCARFPASGTSVGGPVRQVLDLQSLTVLRAVATKLRVRGDGPKAEVTDRLMAVYSDPGAVRELVASAPADEQELLYLCALEGARVPYSPYMYQPRAPQQGVWSVARGLLWPTPEGEAQMPLEVTLALRGDDWVLPFHPVPPAVATASVDAALVEAEAGARLLRLIERVVGLLDIAAGEPIALLKSGGVGVRTFRLLAKQLGAEVEEIEFAIRLAGYANLLVAADPPPPVGRGRARKEQPSPGLIASEDAQVWRQSSAQMQGTLLVSVWWDLETALLADAELTNDYYDSPAFKRVRVLSTQLHASVADGAAVTGDILPSLLWHSPRISVQLAEQVLPATLRESELMGVLALGAATSLARALLADASAVEQAVGRLTSGAETKVTIGADLTAVVFGPPDGTLARFLDSIADRESQGAATTWRFTAGAVRRAFDEGATAAELIDKLDSVAATGVPQALTYLINDMARKHGHVSVAEVGSVVISDDHALLLEIAGNRKLAKLGLWSIAPTVVASTVGAELLLTGLRSEGYAPVLRRSDGQVSVSRSAPTDLEVPGSDFIEYLSPRFLDVDPAAQAELLMADLPAADSIDFTDVLPESFDRNQRRSFVQGSPIAVNYRDAEYVVHSARLYGNIVMAWNVTTGDYENFEVMDLSPAR